VLELAAALVLTGLNAGQMGTAQIGIYGVSALAGVMYAGIGRLIASRVPGNAIGWLLCLIGLSLAAVMLTEQYALHGLATAPGSLPAARLAGWLSGTLFVPAFAPVFFLVLLFPDGRLPSREMHASWPSWCSFSAAVMAPLPADMPDGPAARRPGRPPVALIAPERCPTVILT